MELMLESSSRLNKLERHLGIFHQPRTPPSNFRERSRVRSDHAISSARDVKKRPVGRNVQNAPRSVTRSQSDFAIPKAPNNPPLHTTMSAQLFRGKTTGVLK